MNDLAHQEQLGIDLDLLSKLAIMVEGAEWARSDLKGVSTIHSDSVGGDLKTIRGAIWEALVANGKISRKDDSGNLLQVEGCCSLSISKKTHIVPIAIVGKPPSDA
ncbi:uncharacterized protein FPRO_03828 [Fusarium proliferatum ET1]|uniref:Uncharacterized protein n=1 Tax=Fusarium proliferatum (strain ET1) TaxID=1227346 RepID=A0A1L7V6U0_FUSPR|nr:uncharacterized protein FPRO_03828 [Fusarium proliferatum ET1]CZR35912.1 uncharacterized protein FPRO_03828 [Fusarium proliferatum ET1]